MKTKIITGISLLTLLFQLASNGIIYPMVAIVSTVDTVTDEVFFEDTKETPNLWCYKGVEDWCEDDIAGLLMFNNFTPEISDDIILSARYNGTIYDLWKGDRTCSDIMPQNWTRREKKSVEVCGTKSTLTTNVKSGI